MQKKIVQIMYLFTCFYPHTYAIESEATQINSCPEIILCKSSDNSKQTHIAYTQDQKSYQCYYKFGDVDMAKIAGKAMTLCQTMYGSINPTTRKN